MKSIVRDQFKDSMDSVFEHLAQGKTGKVTVFFSFKKIFLTLLLNRGQPSCRVGGALHR